MPYTRRQVKYLLSSGSPLTDAQKEKMKGELHADPAMGHKKKGSAAMERKPEANVHTRNTATTETQSSTYDWRKRMGKGKKGNWAR